MKKVLLWFLLVILVVFLLLPPGLRLFAKDLYKEVEEKKKDVVTVLNCKKNEDVINTTYFNDKPYDFRYSVVGNYRDTSENSEENELDNAIVAEIKGSSMVSYNEEANKTDFHIIFSSVEMISEKLANYTKKPDEQRTIYDTMGFVCTITKV